MRKVARFAFLAAAALSAGGCAKLTLAWADLSGAGPEARPPVLEFSDGVAPAGGGDPDLARWTESEAPKLRAAFERHVYGRMPEASSTEIVSRRIVDEAAFGGAARIEEYDLVATATFDGVARRSRPFRVNLAIPAGADGPVPVIVIEAFCPRSSTMPHPGVSRLASGDFCEGDGFMSDVMRYVFGRYIATPPIETILARGYAVAAVFPSEAIPDAAEEGLAALVALSGLAEDDPARWGAVAAWGWMFSRVADALLANPGLDPEGFIAFGHSRYGKAALVAAAYDSRIAAVVSHQSGTGGASLNRRKKGESVAAITKSYPHWFAPAYAGYAGREDALPVDQHQLLALIAPRPVLLGNARRDVWSDPNGAFRAAKGADAAYELFGARGLTQDRLDGFDPTAELSFWIRPGTHGVVEEDWPAFLDFLDAHFASDSRLATGRRAAPAGDPAPATVD